MPVFQPPDPSVTPNAGPAPQVRTNAEAIGEGVQKLGAGISSFGNDLSDIASVQRRQQRYDTGLSFETLMKQQALNNQNLVQNNQGDGTGIYDQGMKQFDADTMAWLKSVPKNLQPEYTQRMAAARAGFEQQYAGDQYRARHSYEMQTNATGVVDDQNAVAANPAAVQTVLAQRNAQIDAMSATPAEKLALKTEAQRALAGTFLQSQHGTDVGGASEAAGVHLPGGPAPGASGYGATNAPYKAPLDKPGEGGALAPRQLFGFLKSQGASDNEALLLTGAAGSESSFNPNAVHDGGNGHGLFGHNDHRLDMRGKDWEQQASAALQELRSRPESALVNNAKSPEDLAVAEMHFENPRGYTRDNPKAGDNYTGRLNTIRYFSQMTGQTPTGGPAAAGAHPQQTPYQEEDQARFSQPANPLFNVFSPQERLQMVAGVQANAARDRGEVAANVKDDLASMEATGQGSASLTPQRVAGSLGNDAADAWMQQRQAAQAYYGATKDFNTLSDADISQHLASLAPQPGQDGFIMQQQYYAKAQQVAQAVQQQRAADPAGAVAQPNVPASPQVAADRLTAQTKIGIPASMQSPITASEAQPYALALTKALPGQEKQAIQAVTQSLIQTYGQGNADAAMSYILGQARFDASTKAVVGSIFRKIGLGQPITRDDARQFDDAQKTDAANKAVAGILGPNQGSFPTPDTTAIDMLRQNPGLAPKFDAAYGPGRSGQILQFNAGAPSAQIDPGAVLGPHSGTQQGSTGGVTVPLPGPSKLAVPTIPAPKPTGRTPTSGSDAFQQQKQIWEQGANGGDGFGGSGVGM